MNERQFATVKSKGTPLRPSIVPPEFERHSHPGYLRYHSPINSDSRGISRASPRVIYNAANQIRAPFFREVLAP
ncbi:hypothetical protein K0M31_010434 [Melipona bicolor]|uniref:Uncharacterized protein n=1 Tax=Melipona bicolor TaxID=60889 RepID=A0AA40FLZ1_9HYME|nr:hypothetical protein K0M31_010434 [Melipona bicolor]